jgi:hypothetical protein
VFAASCWRDAFVCIACLLSVAIVCAVRFPMCKLVVCVIVSTVLLSESLFVARPAKRLLWAYPLCVKVIVPDVRHCW